MSRADTLLALIRERSHPDGRYFVPSRNPMNCALISDFVPEPHGGGDVSALKGLVRKGLVTRVDPDHYYFRITEEGILRYENVLRPLCDAEPVQVVPPEAP